MGRLWPMDVAYHMYTAHEQPNVGMMCPFKAQPDENEVEVEDEVEESKAGTR